MSSFSIPRSVAAGRPAVRSRRALRVQAAGSTYGTNFRVTTFGESHGKGVGCVIDGVPPRLPITQQEIQVELDRRKPGQSIITTPRKEEDTCEILSGVFDGVTLGTPIAVVVRNKDQRSQDYSEMSVAYRPSHADATYDFKYGIRAVAGGGRSSARETIGRVAAGAVAKKLLQVIGGTEVSGITAATEITQHQCNKVAAGCAGSSLYVAVPAAVAAANTASSSSSCSNMYAVPQAAEQRCSRFQRCLGRQSTFQCCALAWLSLV